MHRSPLAVAALLLLSLALIAPVCATNPEVQLAQLPSAEALPAVDFQRDVAPVLNGRCVVCHGCYDAPCQLLLSSFEGIDRGASKQPVYHSDRLTAADPTRLFVDEASTAGWRRRGFVSVTEAPTGRPSYGLLLQMLALGRTHHFAPGEKLPEDLPLDINRTLACPTLEEFDAYAAEHPMGGMPYGVAPLSDDELRVLAAWVGRGAPEPPAPPSLAPALAAQVKRWEAFLNGTSLKRRITARYLYEHWAFAHLGFESAPRGPFFRIVRSRSAPGAPVEEIATRRPYDPPGAGPFYYRLVPIDDAIVHKTHIVYTLSDTRMRRLRELFLGADWSPTRLPSYAVEEAANPFVSFDQIPARSRYQFLLDDAHYFVMTFIRGPVCRGQVAVDVIEDHFFVSFLDPDIDVSVVDPTFLERAKSLLALPAGDVGSLHVGSLWIKYDAKQKKYLDMRIDAYDRIHTDGSGLGLDDVWDGDGDNRNAMLTVFRHFDNASVVKGFVGEIPKTAWVIDFPIFERIYYNLVAGFDVFGSAAHQVATRLYMDHLRMQSENLFLAFLPRADRKPLRDSWYVGATDQLKYFFVNRLRGEHLETRIAYTSDDPKREFIELLLARSPAVSGPPDRLNRCDGRACERPGASPGERRAEAALRTLAGTRGPWVAPLPELTLVRVRVDGGDDAVYSLAHTRAHTNVAFMFGEDERLVPEDDTLVVMRGTPGSYPNFLFDVRVPQLDAFVAALRAVRGPADLDAVVAAYGVRRSDPRFWASFDWLHADFRERAPTEAGLFDLNRYGNL